MDGSGSAPRDEPSGDAGPGADGRGDLVAFGLGLLALAVACAPPLLFAMAPDDGPRGAGMLADARGWTGLRRFALASAVGLGPALILARLSFDRARRWPAKAPACGTAVAGREALAMVPGLAMIQIVWWTSG